MRSLRHFENVFMPLNNKKKSALKIFTPPRNNGGFFRLFTHWFLPFSFLILVMACEEDPGDIGLNLIDAQPGLTSTDTLSLQAFSVPDDTIPTSFGGQNLLGVLNDPVFGKTRATIFTEIRLPANDFSLGENPVLDSIKLSMAYTGRLYGQEQTFQNLKVYELSENLPDGDTIYAHRFFEHYPDPIGELQLRPAPGDSVQVIQNDEPVVVAPHFTIPLSEEFGQKLIDANDTEAFENVPNFLEYIKGFYIHVDENIDGEGSIFNINMYSTYTSLVMYYHVDDDTLQQVTRFPINEFAKNYTRLENFDFQNAHPLLQQQVLEENLESGDSIVFVQSMGSLRTDIKIPHLEKLAEIPNLAINQARLYLPVDKEFSDELWPEAQRLLLLSYSEEDELEFLSDFDLGSTYFGGLYDENKGQYRFNITKYIQEVLDGTTPNKGLTLTVSNAPEFAHRVVLKGPGRSSRPMKLEIVYTVF